MIHLKSTLAISAIMLSGLVAASPFPYRSDFEPKKPRHTADFQAATAAETPVTPAVVTAWADPPVKESAPVGKSEPASVAEAPAPTIEPVSAPALAVVPGPVRNASLQTTAQVKPEQARRRKVAKAPRERQMATRQAPPAEDAQVASREAPTTSQRIDPIGDILRGLGIGREG